MFKPKTNSNKMLYDYLTEVCSQQPITLKTKLNDSFTNKIQNVIYLFIFLLYKKKF